MATTTLPNIDSFRCWVMGSVSCAPVLEELDAGIALRGPDDLPAMIEVVREAEMFCGRQLQELNLSARAERQRTDGARKWERMLQLIAVHGEAKWWNGKIEWLQDTRIYLENERERYENVCAPTRQRSRDRVRDSTRMR